MLIKKNPTEAVSQATSVTGKATSPTLKESVILVKIVFYRRYINSIQVYAEI